MANEHDEAAVIIKEMVLSVKNLAEKETQLRTQYEIGDRYRVIRDKISVLVHTIEEFAANHSVSLQSDELIKDSLTSESLSLAEGECWVYVYLYNAKGAELALWFSMLSDAALEDYTFNRPIYREESQVQAFIRSRPSDNEYAYLTLKIKETDVIDPESPTKDSLGVALMSLTERSLLLANAFSFVHKGKTYYFNKESGELQV
jgi:hypothetical protein